MNKLTIIGNVTREPEMRTTPNGVNVCTFSVAVNRRKPNQNQPDAEFFRVSAWRQLGEICGKYITKGKKVCVIGEVSCHAYTSNGEAKASLEVTAEDVEFLSPKEEKVDKASGMQVVETELPY